MSALETIGLQATAPSTGAAFPAVAGNSLTIRDSRANIQLLEVIQKRQATVGFNRLTSPLLHDSTVGIQVQCGINTVATHRIDGQKLYAQDTLTSFGSGSATAGDIELCALQVYYENLPGVDANLITIDELDRRGTDSYVFTNTVVATAAGGYTGSVAINAVQDQLKANREYAITGVSGAVSAAVAAWRFVGPDWGNLGICCPAPSVSGIHAEMLSFYFPLLSQKSKLATIPVLNAANKALTFISALADENGGSTVVNVHMVLLAPKTGRR